MPIVKRGSPEKITGTKVATEKLEEYWKKSKETERKAFKGGESVSGNSKKRNS